MNILLLCLMRVTLMMLVMKFNRTWCRFLSARRHPPAAD